MTVLMRIGDHQFTIDDLNYQKFATEYEARWKEHFTAGGGHVDHFLGPAPQSVTLSGILFPESHGGLNEAEALGAETTKGQPLAMYSLAGKSFGNVKVLSLRLSHEVIGVDARVMKASYDLKVSRYGQGADRNPLMGGGGFLAQAANRIRTLF